MQIVSTGDNLHETANSVFCEKIVKNINNLPSVELTNRVIKFKIFFTAENSTLVKQNQFTSIKEAKCIMTNSVANCCRNVYLVDPPHKKGSYVFSVNRALNADAQSTIGATDMRFKPEASSRSLLHFCLRTAKGFGETALMRLS